MFIFKCVLYLICYVTYYIHVFYTVYFVVSFGRKTHTCILKVDHLLYGVSETGSTEIHLFLWSASRQPSLVSSVTHSQCNKNKHIPSIVRKEAARIRNGRRVLFNSVHQSCCTSIHIHIYIYMCNHCIKVSQCPTIWTWVIITNSL